MFLICGLCMSENVESNPRNRTRPNQYILPVGWGVTGSYKYTRVGIINVHMNMAQTFGGNNHRIG